MALLYALTAAQVAVFVVALWQNGWQLETLRNNPWVRMPGAAPCMLQPQPLSTWGACAVNVRIKGQQSLQ